MCLERKLLFICISSCLISHSVCAQSTEVGINYSFSPSPVESFDYLSTFDEFSDIMDFSNYRNDIGLNLGILSKNQGFNLIFFRAGVGLTYSSFEDTLGANYRTQAGEIAQKDFEFISSASQSVFLEWTPNYIAKISTTEYSDHSMMVKGVIGARYRFSHALTRRDLFGDFLYTTETRDADLIQARLGVEVAYQYGFELLNNDFKLSIGIPVIYEYSRWIARQDDSKSALQLGYFNLTLSTRL